MLHAALDFRRVLDVPGYRPVPLDDAARFIGTMNYGYAGTRELNEALVSRFAVVDMPVIAQEDLGKLLRLPGVSFLAQTVSRLIQGRLTAGDRLSRTRPPRWAALFCIGLVKRCRVPASWRTLRRSAPGPPRTGRHGGR